MVSGQPFDGTGPVVPGSNVVVNAPLMTGTILGTTAPFATLTSGDDINLSGTNNELVANLGSFTFGFTQTISGLTISGVQAWDITNSNTIWNSQLTNLWGADITAPDSLSYHDALGSLQIGSGAQPVGMDAQGDMLTTINATNDAFVGGYQYLAISMKASDFNGSNAITVNADGVGNGSPGHHSDWSNFGVIAGPTTGTVGYLDWTVNSSGGVSNNIALGAESATNAVSLTIKDDDATGTTTYLRASWTDGSSPANWANLATIDASATSDQLTVTGGEHSYGLLAGNTTAITTVLGGSGPDVFDLSASTWTSVSGVTINGNADTLTPITTGANSLADSNESAAYVAASGQGLGTVVELSSTEIGVISGTASNAFASWSNVPDLYDVGSSISGTINMADFPGTAIVTLANAHSGNYVDQGGNISVTNAPYDFWFNFQDANLGNHNFSVAAASTDGTGASVVVNYGTGYGFNPGTDTTDTLNVFGYDNATFQLWAPGSGFTQVYGGGVVVWNIGDGNAENVTLNTSLVRDDTPVGGLMVGDIGANGSPTAHVGTTTIEFLGGVLTGLPLAPNFSETGSLTIGGTDIGGGVVYGNVDLGVTNAYEISAPHSSLLMMPDDVTLWSGGSGSGAYTGVSVTAEYGLIQGSMGSQIGGHVYSDVGNDTLTFTNSDGSWVLGDGGADTIDLGSTSIDDTIFFGLFYINGNLARQEVEGNNYANPGFWGTPNNSTTPVNIATAAAAGHDGFTSDLANTYGTSADLSTVANFVLGTLSHDDTLTFNATAWDAGNAAGNGALVEGDYAIAPSGPAVGQTIINHGDLIGATTDVILYTTLGTVANAAQLAADLSGPAGYITFAASNAHTFDMLVAYSDGSNIKIADVHFAGGSTSTEGMTIYASDMVQITGQSSLLTLGTHIGDIQFLHIA